MSRFTTAAVLLTAHFVIITSGVAAAMWGLHGTAADGLYGSIVALWTLPLTLFAVLFMRPRFSRLRFRKARRSDPFRGARALKKERFCEPPRRPVSRPRARPRRPSRSMRRLK